MPWALVMCLLLAGCAADATPPPKEILAPESRLTAVSNPLPPLSKLAQGNEEMWSAYGQCRVSHADVADRHTGLVRYVEAIRRRL